MQWQDEGIILHTHPLGEHKKIVSLFTPHHGRCAGVLSVTQKNKGWIQCGRKVTARWGARLEHHIGHWTLEPLATNIALLFDAPGPLGALVSAASLCHVTLPERHAYLHLYERFEALLKDLATPSWAQSYVFFELALLEEVGYGLALETCAVTGVKTNLAAVSPRTGRAICGEIAEPYQGKLLPLPSFIYKKNNATPPTDQEILDALQLSGYFLERYLLGHALPSARTRLLQRFMKARICA